MPVSLLLLALLSASRVAAEPREVSVTNATHIIKHSFYDPTVLKSRNQLVYVSYPKVNSDVIIQMESDAIGAGLNGSCSIVVSVPADRDFLAPEAKVLADGRLLVGIVESAEAEIGPHLRFYVVDLQNDCAHSDFSVAFDDEILQSYKPFTILPYRDTFDVFAKSYAHCQPPGSMCLVRFNLKGDLLHSLNFEFKTNDSNFDLTQLQPLLEFDPSGGYAYISTETSAVKVLDAELKLLRSKRVRGYVRAQSVLNGDIGVCYHAENEDGEPRTECAQLDARLKPKANVSLGNSMYYAARRLYSLADGGSLLLAVSRGKIDTLLRRLGPDGRLSRNQAFRYECESFLTEPKIGFVEIKPRIYCFSFLCRFTVLTHCVNLTDLPNLSDFAH